MDERSWAPPPPPACIAQELKPNFPCHHAASSSSSSRTSVALAASSCCRKLSSDAWTSRATVPQSLYMRRMLQVLGEEMQRSSTDMWVLKKSSWCPSTTCFVSHAATQCVTCHTQPHNTSHVTHHITCHTSHHITRHTHHITSHVTRITTCFMSSLMSATCCSDTCTTKSRHFHSSTPANLARKI